MENQSGKGVPAETSSLQHAYERMDSERNMYLERARHAAELTIPPLVPREGSGASSSHPTPYQSVGSQGVNNLAGKLVLTMLPPNEPFFRLTMHLTEEQRDELGAAGLSEIEATLASVERTAQKEIETSQIRVTAFEVFRQLVVAGNVCLYMPNDFHDTRLFRLDQYVVSREPSGKVIRLIIKEAVAFEALDEATQEIVRSRRTHTDDSSLVSSREEWVDVYTGVRRDVDGKYVVHQEVLGVSVPGSEGSYSESRLPWLPLRFIRVPNESYGRGLVEEQAGDLVSLEGLCKALVESAAAAAKIIFLVNPNGTTRIKNLQNARNGDFVAGNAEDVKAMQVQKGGDLRVVLEAINRIEMRVGRAFILGTSIQRDAERVTATEIRLVAQELEAALGGVYSSLSQEFQLPLVSMLLRRLEASKKIPKLPADIVQPTIVTGVEALGRGSDFQKLQSFIGQIVQFGPEMLMQYLNIPEALGRLSTSIGIDPEGLVRTQEEIQAEQEEAMQQQMMMQAAGPLVQGAIQNDAQ